MIPLKYESTRVQARVAKVCLGLVIIWYGLNLVGLWSPYRGSTHPTGAWEIFTVSIRSALHELLPHFGLLVWVVAAIFFLNWLLHVSRNLTPLKARGVGFSPGWAVAWWFIPLASLFMPYLIVREVWQKSFPDIELRDGYLTESFAKSPAPMRIWWGLWTGAAFLPMVIGGTFDALRVHSFAVYNIPFVVQSLLLMNSAGLAIWLVGEITERQERRYAKLMSISFENAEVPPSVVPSLTSALGSPPE